MMLLNLNHDNIIKIYEYRDIGLSELGNGVTVPKIYFVLEYAEVGSLLDLLTKTDDYILYEEEARFYMKKLLEAVDFLHSQRYYHRDIKLMNILIHNDEHIVKLADFG
jgi:serine/threonine protein kinase